MAQSFSTQAELLEFLRAWTGDSLPTVRLSLALAQDILENDPVNRKLRPGNLEHLKREISGGHWHVHKSSTMRFLPSGRLADGQHRCRAVVETGVEIVVPMAIVTDTLGVDEGALRTVADHLELLGVPRADASVAANVTRAICKIKNAGVRDYVQYFNEHRDFIIECVQKPQAWLAEHDRVISYYAKPQQLGLMRAQLISVENESAERVDEFLYDIVNDGATAPEGTPRQALARQIFTHLREAHEKRGAKTRDVMMYIRKALQLAQEGKIRNVITAPRDRRPAPRRKADLKEKAA